MKVFVPDIPDGTNISIEGVNGIGFRWLQGKPVPNACKVESDPEKLLNIKKETFKRGCQN